MNELIRPSELAVMTGVRLRPLVVGDAESLARHGNDRAVWRNMRDRFPHPYAVENGRFFIENVAGDPTTLTLGIEVEGEAVGVASVLPKHDISRRSAEIGYWIGRAYWGRGIVTEVVRALTAYAFANYDLVRLYAVVFAWNPASGRVLEKAGYALEARLRKAVTKDGETIDGLLYAAVNEE